jgi:hypothetical protein
MWSPTTAPAAASSTTRVVSRPSAASAPAVMIKSRPGNGTPVASISAAMNAIV